VRAARHASHGDSANSAIRYTRSRIMPGAYANRPPGRNRSALDARVSARNNEIRARQCRNHHGHWCSALH
jgi:hypothetical protein